MAGMVRQLKNGKWELGVSLGFDLLGKRIRKYKHVEASGKREAERLLAEFITECSRKNYNEGAKMTLKNFTELWMKDYAEKHLKKRTIYRYKSLLERITYCLGHKNLSDIKPTHLIEFYNILESTGIRKDGKSQGLSSKTVRHHHALVSSILQTAVNWGLIEKNVASKVKPPKVEKKEQSTLTKEQIKKLIKALNVEELKYRCIVTIALFTGFRRGEIMGLEWSDINFEEKYIFVNKTANYTATDGIYEDTTKTAKSKRRSYIPTQVILLLDTYRSWWEEQKEKLQDRWHETDKLFIQWDGRPMHPDTISQWFPKFIRRHNLDYIKFHGLRHEHGSILLAMGMDLMSVAEQMGHASAQMLVSTYGHNVSNANEKVADYMAKAIYDEE